jgi:hypothetical protein
MPISISVMDAYRSMCRSWRRSIVAESATA